MTIEQHAQAILDICQAGPIGGGIRLKLEAEAQEILDSFKWIECSNRTPLGEQLVKVQYPDGSESIDWWEHGFGWYDPLVSGHPVRWRELV